MKLISRGLALLPFLWLITSSARAEGLKSDRAGTETAQLYVHETYAPVSTPIKQLRGFERVALKPGETKTVSFHLTPEALQLLDIDMRWRVVPGDFEIMAGKSSAEIPLQGILKVTP